jgi:transposase-like protein
MIAIGINEEGYCEILDIEIIYDESYATYKAFFDTLKERGVEKVSLLAMVIRGLKKLPVKVS